MSPTAHRPRRRQWLHLLHLHRAELLAYLLTFCLTLAASHRWPWGFALGI